MKTFILFFALAVSYCQCLPVAQNNCVYTPHQGDTLTIILNHNDIEKEWFGEFVTMMQPIVYDYTLRKEFLLLCTNNPSLVEDSDEFEALEEISEDHDSTCTVYKDYLRTACMFFGEHFYALDSVKVICFSNIYGSKACFEYPHENIQLVWNE